MRPYILNWIKKQGGSPTPPNLQNKSVTITENGTTTIQADTGYDGLNSVTVNTNVTSSTITVPSKMKFGNSTWTEIPSNIDFGNVESFSQMFISNQRLTEVRSIDTSSGVQFDKMFNYCSYLVTVNLIDTSNGTTFDEMFNSCVRLVNIPQFDFSSMTSNYNIFSGCSALSNTSLNNILASVANGTSVTSAAWKSLKRMGLTQAQATTCQSLSNWDAFVAAGWTTGY